MSIVIAGTGYVGLVTGVCLAEMGFSVICVDRDAEKIAMLTAGDMPIFEPGLTALAARHLERRLRFSTDLSAHVPGADIVFIAVGTPARQSGDADLGAVFAAAEEIAQSLTGRTVIAIKSTVPPGTAARVARLIARINPDIEFAVASNPEFLREGSAIEDFLSADRIVVGLSQHWVRECFERLYASLAADGTPIVFMSNEAAELTKYAANTYLAMRIAYVNELADLCEAVGADIGEVVGGMGLDSRIGLHYLAPGPGFGGSCFPKDTRALMAAAQAAGVPFTLGEATISSNERRKERLLERVVRVLGSNIEGRRVGILGVAFKANTDDIRDGAAPWLIGKLQGLGIHVQAYDPEAMENASLVLDDVTWTSDSYAAGQGADAVVVMTEWQEFRRLDLHRLAAGMRTPVLIDFRNLFTLSDAAAAGLSYLSVGRAAVERLAVTAPSATSAARRRKSMPHGPRASA